MVNGGVRTKLSGATIKLAKNYHCMDWSGTRKELQIKGLSKRNLRN